MDSDLVSQFMEVTACESQAAAVRELSSCQWNLEKAVNLFFAAGPSNAAPPPPHVEEEEVRAPIPTRVERLCDDSDDSYRGTGIRTDRAAWSMWDTPSPKPVPAVPVLGLSPSEIQASGWGVADEPDNGGGKSDDAEEEQVNEVKVSGWGEAEPGNGISDAEEEKSIGSQEDAHDDVQENDLSGVEGYGMGSNEGQDGEHREDEEVDVVNYNEDEESEHDNVSDKESEMEDYGLEMDEDDHDHDDSLMEYEDEEPRRPSQRPESLAEMYRLPQELMFRGTFHFAKVYAAMTDRFLLVNLQTEAFVSCLQNRDLWANEVVNLAVKDNFVFQLLRKMNDDSGDGTKVCTFYKIQDNQLPAVLVLDPITGQMLSRMSGAIEPDEFMLFIEKYTNSKPSKHSRPRIVPKAAAVLEGSETAASAGVDQEHAVPESSASPGSGSEEQEQAPVAILEEEAPAEMVDYDDEPMEGEKMYKLRVRFPDGSVVSKEFGSQRRVSKLFAFCSSAVRDARKTEQVAFRIMRLNGRAFEELENNGATFEELGLNFATMSVFFST